MDGGLHLGLLGDEVLGREDVQLLQVVQDFAGERVEGHHALDLVPEHRDPEGLLAVGGDDLQRVALGAEGAGPQFQVVALVVDVDQVAQDQVAPDGLPDVQVEHHLAVGFRVAQAVDARHRGHDQHVAAAEEGRGRGQAQPVDILVDVGFLLDIQVLFRDVGFRLVVIVVRDEILDGIVREEVFELGVKLGGQGLVVAHHQRGTVDLGHHRRDGEGLAGAGRAQQSLVAVVPAQAVHQPGDGRRLIAGRLEFGYKLKLSH